MLADPLVIRRVEDSNAIIAVGLGDRIIRKYLCGDLLLCVTQSVSPSDIVAITFRQGAG